MPAYANKNRKSRSLDYGKALLMPSSIPEGWSYEINDEGKAAYIHETTKQKVCQNILWSWSRNIPIIMYTCNYSLVLIQEGTHNYVYI